MQRYALHYKVSSADNVATVLRRIDGLPGLHHRNSFISAREEAFVVS